MFPKEKKKKFKLPQETTIQKPSSMIMKKIPIIDRHW